MSELLKVCMELLEEFSASEPDKNKKGSRRGRPKKALGDSKREGGSVGHD